jgi:hypothetical protein
MVRASWVWPEMNVDRDDHRDHLKGQWQKTVRIAELFDERIHLFQGLLDQAAVSEYTLDKLLKTVYRGDDARGASELLQSAAWGNAGR